MFEKLEQLAVSVVRFFFGSTIRFILLLILVLAPAAMFTTLVSQQHPSKFTVMVTNLSESSGGSGSTIYSSNMKSIVLTNAHVCEVLNEEGGFVKKEDGSKYLVTGYRKSEFHDLCAVWVAADLGDTVSLSPSAPRAYSEATITGHPALLPNIINKGSFGERKVISVMTGVKKCSEDTVKTEQDATFCAIFGMIPIVTNYESVIVSAMIMGGSSGSAVLNKDGELSGVVFAGQGGGLSYAFIVPYEYVAVFLKEEMTTFGPLTKVPLEDKGTASLEEVIKARIYIANKCKQNIREIQRFCMIVKDNLPN